MRTSYREVFAGAVRSGIAIEDAVKLALSEITQRGVLTQQDAERINGVSFRAAQLDANLDSLFDNRGSTGDPTIAVLPIDRAIARARDVLAQIESGTIAVPPRSLSAPSNSIPSNATSGLNPLPNVTGPGGAAAAGDLSRQGFLWKPVSESNGNLVVLLPRDEHFTATA